jgi:hypothetical protein
MYARGLGTKSDYVEANKWALIAKSEMQNLPSDDKVSPKFKQSTDNLEAIMRFLSRTSVEKNDLELRLALYRSLAPTYGRH